MDIVEAEKWIRSCIEERRAEGRIVCNTRTANILQENSDEIIPYPGYWDYSEAPLCLIGALRATNVPNTTRFGLSISEATHLEDGFEGWVFDSRTPINMEDPFYMLGRRLGEECETYTLRK